MTGVKFVPIPPKPEPPRVEEKIEVKLPSTKIENKVFGTLKKDKSLLFDPTSPSIFSESELFGDVGGKRSPSDTKLQILNFGSIRDMTPRDPNELSEVLVSIAYYSLHEHIEFKNGDLRVDYKKWAKSESFAVFEEHACYLQRVEPRRIGTFEEQLAFWINVHNALVFHACANHGIPSSEKDRKFFVEAAYKIGDFTFSINDIAVGILRENAKKQFSEDDLRRQLAVQFHPCIHFALVQPAKSSPFFGVYSSEEITYLLQWATYVYLEREVDVSFARNAVVLPRIFQDSQKDFGKDIGEVLGFVGDFLGENKCKLLRFVVTMNPEVQYREYEWSSAAPALLAW